MATTVFLWALIVAAATWQFLTAAARMMQEPAVVCGSIEARRRALLRRTSLTYALAGSLARRCGAALVQGRPGIARAVDLSLKRAGEQASWLPEDWLGVRMIEGLVFGMMAGAASCIAGWTVAATVVVAVAGALTSPPVSFWILRRRGRIRVRRIRARLPFVVDAVALMMEAGASFRDGLAFAARTCGSHPISEELSRCLAAVERGRPTADALDDLGTRLGDPMVYEFASTAASSMKKGHAVSASLLAMSVRMRHRRSHEIEAAAGRAQVQLHYPGLLLLLVCMAVMAAPFLAPLGSMMQSIAPMDS
jgi:Flp pilus assembly protein TadB